MLTIEHEIISSARDSEHVNEDAYFYNEISQRVTLLVADGASQRVKSEKMAALLRDSQEPLTLAAYAARLTRDTVMQNPTLSPKEMLLKANAALSNAIKHVYDIPEGRELTPEAILRQEPNITYRQIIRENPRLFRLLLPVCVATVVEIDRQKHELTFAHAGDTALFVFGADGTMEQITADQMAQHDQRALAEKLGQPVNVPDWPREMPLNTWNGIYHNYVDTAGKIDPQVGVGVINGLPQLADYIQTGTLSLASAAGMLLCSDGLIWPAKFDETLAEQRVRFQHMHDKIVGNGLAGYVSDLRRVEQEDFLCQIYARFKPHDDATGIYVRFK